MGIPGLFKNCIQKYNNSSNMGTSDSNSKKIINTSIREGVKNRLYLDFNCAIYYVLKPEMKSQDTLIIHTLAYLDTLCSMIDDLELIYIALDGVPPRAKMEQQRSRRFHSVVKKKKAQKINDKYGNDLDKTNYNFEIDTNMITPGTEFMDRLSKEIRNHISTKKNYNNIKVIFSDSNCPGEGEHKILDHIRDNPHGDECNSIIYGLDGDLIMLSLVSRQKNLYLLREAVQYGGYAKEFEGHKYLFLDIDSLIVALLDDFQSYMSYDLDMNLANNYIDDYIVLCFILGNDFVPKIYWFSLYEGGHGKLIRAYFEVHNSTEEFLVNKETMKMNVKMLMDIFQALAFNEDKSVAYYMNKRQRLRINVNSDMSERERQQKLIDFYPLQYLDVEKVIEPKSYMWRKQYYKLCFNCVDSAINLEAICKAYIKTIIWNFNYYFKHCCDWSFYYPYHYSPTALDIYRYLETVSNYSSISGGFNTNSKPLKQQTLLLMVLPFQSRELMANSISKNLELSNSIMNIYFPKSYTLNVAFHMYYYECTANIPKLDIDIVNTFINSCKLSSKEKERNTIGNLFIKDNKLDI